MDEAGRGPLAGPVIAAAVILDPLRPMEGLADSKALTASQREHLEPLIQQGALAWCLGSASVEEIDRDNIFRATLLAMQRAVAGLALAPDRVLVDGTHCPAIAYPVQAVVRGDSTIACISAASILAKVARDREMVALDGRFPGYGFARHKGYPTREHLDALRRLGVTEVHRRSYRPVREISEAH